MIAQVVPTQVSAGTEWLGMIAGAEHTCGIGTDDPPSELRATIFVLPSGRPGGSSGPPVEAILLRGVLEGPRFQW